MTGMLPTPRDHRRGLRALRECCVDAGKAGGQIEAKRLELGQHGFFEPVGLQPATRDRKECVRVGIERRGKPHATCLANSILVMRCSCVVLLMGARIGR